MQWLGKIIINLLGLNGLFVRRDEFAERLGVMDAEVAEARRQAQNAVMKQTDFDRLHDEFHRAQARRGRIDLDAEIEKMKRMRDHREKVEAAISGTDHDPSPRRKSKSSSDPDADD